MKNITDICLKYVGVLGLVYIARFVFRRNNSTTPCDRVALYAISIWEKSKKQKLQPNIFFKHNKLFP